jgi:hypothetical protein
MILQERLKEVVHLVGQPYEMFFEGSTQYKGCFAPIYFVYPELPKYKLSADFDPKNNYNFGLKKILKNAEEIDSKAIKGGDVLVTSFRGELHVALLLDKFRFIHVFLNHTAQINKMSFFKKDKVKFFRVRNA